MSSDLRRPEGENQGAANAQVGKSTQKTLVTVPSPFHPMSTNETTYTDRQTDRQTRG